MATLEKIISIRDNATEPLQKIAGAFGNLSGATEQFVHTVNGISAIKSTLSDVSSAVSTHTQKMASAFSNSKIGRIATAVSTDVYNAFDKSTGATAQKFIGLGLMAGYPLYKIGVAGANSARKISNAFKSHLQKAQNSVKEFATKSRGLLKQIVVGNIIATAIGSIVGMVSNAIGSIGETAEHMASIRGRLNMITGDANESASAFREISASAERSRGEVLVMADAALKLKQNAGDTFHEMNEAIAFTESMQKVFKIGGSTAEEQRSAMLQLSQALASGKLQGDELRSVAEAAPQVLDYIAKSMNVSRGAVKQLASEGKITADILKKAMIDGADDINKKFNQLPKTWGSNFNSIKNNTIEAFAPVMDEINKLANNPAVQAFIDGTISAIKQIAPVVQHTFAIIGDALTFIGEKFNQANNFMNKHKDALRIVGLMLTPLIAGMLIFASASIASSVASGIATTTALAWTGAQWLLNTAISACPIVWIIAGIAMVTTAIAGLIYYMLDLGDKSETVAGGIVYAFTYMFVSIYNAGVWFWNGTIQALANGKRAFSSFTSAVSNFFIGMWNGIKSATASAINSILNAIGKIPGISSMFDLSPVSFEATAYVSPNVNAGDDLLSYQAKQLDVNNEATYAMNKVDGFFKTESAVPGTTTGTHNATTMTSANQAGAGGAGGGGNSAEKRTAKNTDAIKKSMEISNEQLKLLRTTAEREAIKRYTNATIKIDVGGLHMQGDANNSAGLMVQLKQVLSDAVHSGIERGCK